MKKLFAILAVTAIIMSCNDTATTAPADSDSAKAAATADSLAAIKTLADTTKKMEKMDTAVMKMDTTASKTKAKSKAKKDPVKK